ncbi:MAG: hypothetical protein RL272_501 [Candidatus Parcubacteria bacterium]|jgi:type IV pilus assembly protein PilA
MQNGQKIRSNKAEPGFTLLEILLAVALLATLAGIVILALNPAKQLGETRNAQRRSDVSTILDAMYQYSIDNSGTFPGTIPTGACGGAAGSICKTGGTCTGIVDLGPLTTNEKYIVSIPTDPTGATTNGSGYFVSKTAGGRITICAPSAEQGATISVTR